MPTEPSRIRLEFPIEADGAKVEEVLISRPKAFALERFLNEPRKGTAMILMIADLAGLTPEQVRSLDASDFSVISEVVTGFLPRAPQATFGE